MARASFISRSPVSNRIRAIRNTLWIILFLNLAVALAKFIYGVMTDAASLQADGIHSIFDATGNIVGIVGITLAARPADLEHPYGHSKFETYASLIIGLLLLLAAYRIVTTSVTSLMEGRFDATITPISFAVMIITLIINIGVTTYERHQGKKYDSEILLADASHTLSDVLVSTGVIFGLVLISMGIKEADPIMALLVSVVILCTAIDIFRRGLRTLSDRARIPEEDIYACALEVPGVEEAHRIRTRGTSGEVYVDLHVLVDPSMSVFAAHKASDEVEAAIKGRFAQVREVLVHIEPYDESELEEANALERELDREEARRNEDTR